MYGNPKPEESTGFHCDLNGFCLDRMISLDFAAFTVILIKICQKNNIIFLTFERL